MNITDALIVTGLGMGVVYIGLILTNLMIYSFSIVPRLLERMKQRRLRVKSEPVVKGKPAQVEPPAPPVAPEVLAVITTVIETEWRLRTALME